MKLTILSFSALLALTTAAVAVEPPVTECDRLAASPYDSGALVPGVPFEDVEAAAVRACREALAADARNPRLQYQLARALEASGKNAEALALYDAAADSGYPAAMNGAARMYLRGAGVAADADKAIALYGRAALLGDLAAQVNLGALYDEGNGGVHVDPATSFLWYQMAAERGEPQSQAKLGYFYAIGRGVAPDYARARGWLEKAAAQGDATSFYNLAHMYAAGTGVDVDDHVAADYYFRAIIAGSQVAIDTFAARPQEVSDHLWLALEQRLYGTYWRGRPSAADGVPDADFIGRLAEAGGFDIGATVEQFEAAMASGGN
jgi:TPR repeat protein